MRNYDVIVIGGGAAGLMCALTAGQRGRRVVVLEGSNKIGKKILMSGGGRCNFTNLHCEPSRFLSANPQFCISALSRYTQWDFIALVEKHGIAYHEKTAGQLFCDESSKQVVAMLRAECDGAGVEILSHCQIDKVTHSDGYIVSSNGSQFGAASLVVATGGLSIPKMGASDFGYRLARQFGHKVLETRAGLVPFTFTGAMHELLASLAGVSLRANLSTCGASFSDDVLFTHRGMSGPAALQLSSYWQPGESVSVDLLPGTDANELLLRKKKAQPRAQLRNVLAEQLPRALVTALQPLLWSQYAQAPVAEVPDKQLGKLAARLGNWSIKPAATEGYRTAEVTLGGVDTNELSSRTMESHRHPGLYFIGEVVDVTGHLGGFNFQWAWASGHAAGEVA
ncbi:MAG: NAD(P)/FAD-dependent oxidoreductase [Gammaproteobacteria bacterium]|nr:NAD(P)/FAD-dependent oxidoreductase [Gammaproteobacteria bacterium]